MDSVAFAFIRNLLGNNNFPDKLQCSFLSYYKQLEMMKTIQATKRAR